MPNSIALPTSASRATAGIEIRDPSRASSRRAARDATGQQGFRRPNRDRNSNGATIGLLVLAPPGLQRGWCRGVADERAREVADVVRGAERCPLESASSGRSDACGRVPYRNAGSLVVRSSTCPIIGSWPRDNSAPTWPTPSTKPPHQGATVSVGPWIAETAVSSRSGRRAFLA
jgi:hypothetical protein